MLASLPPVTGLYTALIPVLVYMIMGTSRHLSVGKAKILWCLPFEKIFFSRMDQKGPTPKEVQRLRTRSSKARFLCIKNN